MKNFREDLTDIAKICDDVVAVNVEDECRMILSVVLGSPLNKVVIRCDLDDYETVYQELSNSQKQFVNALTTVDLGLVVAGKPTQIRQRLLEWYLYKYLTSNTNRME